MKTKKLISLVAMAAMVASCSQEEFAPVGESASVNLGNRPVLGNVALGIGAQTRMAIEEGSSLALAWADGDQIGACIIDQPIGAPDDVDGKDLQGQGGLDFSSLSWTYAEYVAGTKKQGTDGGYYTAQEAGIASSEFYKTVDWVSSNYPYTKKGNVFTTPANLVEGNYMFYAPYNEKQLMRARVNAVLPQIQDCTDKVMKDTKYKGGDVKVSSTVLEQFYAGTMEGFEKAPVAVGYKFLAAPADGSLIEPSIAMTHLYAFPMITIVNDFNGYFYGDKNVSTSKEKATATMTVDSIQIYDDGSNLFYTAPIKSANIASVLAVDGDWDDKRLTGGSNTADLLDTQVKAYPGHAETDLAKAKLDDVNTALGYKNNHVTCVIGKELKNGEAYHFHAILPAADYTKNLKARLFVTIDGKRYVIAGAQNTAISAGDEDPTTGFMRSASYADFTFEDNVNGGMNCQLVRGEHFPKAEIREDGTGTKAFAGTMMTLSMAEATAFELKTVVTPPAEASYGFTSNEDFINYLIDNVQRGVSLKEVAELDGIEREDWKTYTNSPTVTTASAGHIAFAEDTKCVINAQLIKDLKQQTSAAGTETLTLTSTNLPIADDVTFTVSGTNYTFTTLGENAVSYKIIMEAGVQVGSTANELVSGINNIGSTSQGQAVTGELKVKAGVTNAVVYLAGASSYATTMTVKDCTGISAIYVGADTELIVDGACSSLIIATGGKITITSNGSLTNANNTFAAGVQISNSSLRTINGTLADGVVVSATFSASWPTTAIPAASKVNTVSINTSVAGMQTINQAEMDIFANLNDVALTLGNNITGITSSDNVNVVNLKSISAGASIEWTTTSNSGISVNFNGASVTSITADANTQVTFVGAAD